MIEKKLQKKFTRRFAKKQDALPRLAAEMGDGMGNLVVPDEPGMIYVLVHNKPEKVYNDRVPNQSGTQIWIGYSPEEPRKRQVLSRRSSDPMNGQPGPSGWAPSRYYEWHAPGGGQDMLHVHARALTHLRLSVSGLQPETFEVYVNLYKGFVYTSHGFAPISRADYDVYAHIPTTTGKAALVLFTINDDAQVVMTKGTEVDIADLMDLDVNNCFTHLPPIPVNTVWISGAVRVYQGQTVVQEGRTNTDILDLRFVSVAAMGGTSVITWNDLMDTPYEITEDLSDQIDGVTAHFDLSNTAVEKVAVYCNILQPASSYAMDDDYNGFTLGFVPTTSDSLLVRYKIQ